MIFQIWISVRCLNPLPAYHYHPPYYNYQYVHRAYGPGYHGHGDPGPLHWEHNEQREGYYTKVGGRAGERERENGGLINMNVTGSVSRGAPGQELQAAQLSRGLARPSLDTEADKCRLRRIFC